MVRERIARLGDRWRYHVFISYAQGPDHETACRLRHALKSVGSAHLRRAGRMRVFVDNRSLGANPALTDHLAGRLDQSGALVLLASPSSRDSGWVGQELRHWFDQHKADETKPHAGLPVLVLTGGDLVWDLASNDFDWNTPEAGQPLSRAIFEHRYRSQPLWVDLRGKGGRRPSRREVRDAATKVAAGVLDLDRELVAAEEQTRLRRQRWAASVIAVTLLITSLVAARSWAEAMRQRRLENAQRLVTAASGVARTDVGLLLTAEAYRLAPERQTSALLAKVAEHSRLQRVLLLPPRADTLHDLAFSADGSRLAGAGGIDGPLIFLWPGDGSGQPRLLRVPGPDLTATTVAFSPDSRWVAAGGSSGSVTVLRLDTGAEVARLPGTGNRTVQRVRFQPGSTRLAISYLPQGTDTTTPASASTLLWRVGQPAGPAFAGGEATFDPQGKRLATVEGDRAVTIRDVASGSAAGNVIRSIALPGAQSLDWSRDGSRLAVAAGTSVSLVNSNTWSVEPLPDALPASMVRFGADRTLISDTGAGAVLQVGSGATTAVNRAKVLSYALAVRPGGASYAVGGRWADTASGGFVMLWSIYGGPLTAQPVPGARGPMALLPEGRGMAVVGADGVVRLVSVLNGTPATPPLAPGVTRPDEMVASPDGRCLVAVRGRQLSVWSTNDGSVKNAALPVAASPASPYRGLAVSSDSSTVAVTGPDGVPRLLSLRDPLTEQRLIRTGSAAQDLAFSRNGRTLAVATGSDGVQLWNARTATRIKVLPGTTTALVFAGDSLVTTDGRRTIRRNLDDGRSTGLASGPGVMGRVTRLAVDPAEKLLVVGADGGASTIWDLASGHQIATLQTPVALNSLHFTTAGTELIAAGTYVYRWRLDREGWLKWICSVAQRNLTDDEVRTLGVRASTTRPCPSPAP